MKHSLLVFLICLSVLAIGHDAVRGPAHAQAGTAARTGAQIYQTHCAECHGSSGRGDGPAAHLLTVRPRDFSSGRYKIRSTETGTLPTDADLTRSVQQGLYGSSMPAWQQVLSDDDIGAVVQYIKGLSPRFASEAPQRIVPAPAVPPTPAGLAKGEAVYEKLQCGKCHGSDGRGAGAVATTFEDDWRQPISAADLTEPWTFRGGATSADVFMRFRAGMSGTPMPSFKDSATDAEMWDLANYLLSLARKPVWEMTATEAAAFLARQEAEALAHPAKRGQYLVDTLGCPLCHSPVDEQKRLIPGLRLAGGLRMRIAPFGEYPTGNLTSDRETGLGSWTDQEIKRAFTQGILRDGTRLLPYPMDWASFATMKSEDVDAIVAYLRTVPPVRNKVPAPTRTFLPLYLWGKFQMLLLGDDPPITIYAGNAGSASAETAR